jgi:hypothetical protein
MSPENSPPDSEIGGKDNGHLLVPPFEKSFTDQLKWHLQINGTRPDGLPGKRGEPWLDNEFADKLYSANHRTDKGDIRKNLGNWLGGMACHPRWLRLIDKTLFGGNQAYDEWSRQFRNAGAVQWRDHLGRRKGRRSSTLALDEGTSSDVRVITAPGLIPHGFSIWTDPSGSNAEEDYGQTPPIAEANSHKVQTLHRLLFMRSTLTGAPTLKLSLPKLCDEVEGVVKTECCALAGKLILESFGITHIEKVSRPPNAIGAFTLAGERVYLSYATQPTEDGIELVFKVQRSYSGESLMNASHCRVDGLGRITQILVEQDPILPGLKSGIAEQLANLAWAWYSALERYCARQLQRMVANGVDEMYRFIKSILPLSAREAVWLYALVGDYGISLSNAAIQERATAQIARARDRIEASPLEAAISLIGIRLERVQSFSNLAIASIDSSLVELRKTLYDRIIQDAETGVFNTGTLRAMGLAVTANKELGVVAAFPAGDLADEKIIPTLMKHRVDFQRRLERMAEELRFLLGVATEFNE